ncbi:hypothetical protein CYMTET_11479 [Cymbomonas tetramitiformis]|uniref:HNH domain-containing protein n=2 Tax=Cymbomonas tetramitiformis TaxID=36881 RepID=A0AAE0LCZ1_9CHLO|nr:hypothetical protein CYMTET_11479 [Cymbomonas tetramitiformis]
MPAEHQLSQRTLGVDLLQAGGADANEAGPFEGDAASPAARSAADPEELRAAAFEGANTVGEGGDKFPGLQATWPPDCPPRFLPERGFARKRPELLKRDSDGRSLCRYCSSPLKPPKRTFCGEECVHEYKLRTSSGYVRTCLLLRDLGVCRLCGLPAHLLYSAACAAFDLPGAPGRRGGSRPGCSELKDVLGQVRMKGSAGMSKWNRARLLQESMQDFHRWCIKTKPQADMASLEATAEIKLADDPQEVAQLEIETGAFIRGFLEQSRFTLAIKHALQSPASYLAPGMFWQADHEVAVAEGGGSCGLDNLRTLCTACHAGQTSSLRTRLLASPPPRPPPSAVGPQTSVNDGSATDTTPAVATDASKEEGRVEMRSLTEASSVISDQGSIAASQKASTSKASGRADFIARNDKSGSSRGAHSKCQDENAAGAKEAALTVVGSSKWKSCKRKAEHSTTVGGGHPIERHVKRRPKRRAFHFYRGNREAVRKIVCGPSSPGPTPPLQKKTGEP